MEALLLLLDAVVMLVAAYMVLKDDRHGPNQEDRSLFRMTADRFVGPGGGAEPRGGRSAGRGAAGQSGRAR